MMSRDLLVQMAYNTDKSLTFFIYFVLLSMLLLMMSPSSTSSSLSSPPSSSSSCSSSPFLIALQERIRLDFWTFSPFLYVKRMIMTWKSFLNRLLGAMDGFAVDMWSSDY